MPSASLSTKGKGATSTTITPWKLIKSLPEQGRNTAAQTTAILDTSGGGKSFENNKGESTLVPFPTKTIGDTSTSSRSVKGFSNRYAQTCRQSPLSHRTWARLGVQPKSSPSRGLRDVVSVAVAFRPRCNTSDALYIPPQQHDSASAAAVAQHRQDQDDPYSGNPKHLRHRPPTASALGKSPRPNFATEPSGSRNAGRRIHSFTPRKAQLEDTNGQRVGTIARGASNVGTPEPRAAPLYCR
eukprot:IDg5521t1